MLKVADLNKRFVSGGREVVALQDVNLEVADQEFLCLLGPTGCGKSTLLNIFAGFEREDSGAVTIDDAPISGAGPERGVVFQEHGLFPWLTVLGNVTFGPRMRGRDRRSPAVGRWRSSNRSASRTPPTGTRTSCRAACASAPPSRASCSTSPGCC